MKICFVIHGYPRLYNAGSEIYTQTIAHGFADQGHDVHVFSRVENPFEPSYKLTVKWDRTKLKNKIKLHLINVAKLRDRYVNLEVDKKFRQLLTEINPDIIHFQHLNHLSISLISIAYEAKLPIIFTLHDYWLACPRGQFIQMNYGEQVVAQLCDGQENRKCAVHCYSRYFTGTETDHDFDVKYWTEWVRIRQDLIRKIIMFIDLFIAPSYTVLNRITSELDIPTDKIVYLDYGFDHDRLIGRVRNREKKIVFGYIGTHQLTKGIHLLLEAFSKLTKKAELRIWGRPRNETTPYLEKYANKLINEKYLSIKWFAEYQNQDIIKEVFNEIDVLVVPSIWDENSPLVIHEALQVRIPVITANHGGMSEYVYHNVNGRLFKMRDVQSLANEMQYFLDNPDKIDILGVTGYIQSEVGNVVSNHEHLYKLMEYYNSLLRTE